MMKRYSSLGGKNAPGQERKKGAGYAVETSFMRVRSGYVRDQSGCSE